LAAAQAPAAPAPLQAATQTSAPRDPLLVMSYNIRYGTAKDGVNEWSQRRDMLFDVLRNTGADVVGLQEALDFQIDEILAAVPVYAVVGVGRYDGGNKGEFAANLIRKDRYKVAEA
jgi:endonuclease/exonuclease/phosphatase family metal-dependent hydrolase